MLGFLTTYLPSWAQERFSKEIQLDEFTYLTIEQPKDRIVEVTLSSDFRMLSQHTIGNAMIRDEWIQRVELDTANEDQEIVITIPDASSTYGALNGIVIYKYSWWNFFIIPSDLFEIEDTDDDGIHEIVLSRREQKSYTLQSGILVEK
ncbi:MAG TPA: hypothetical protein DCR93_36460 [Cytophagales bacterium]|nr:hypothetical protein [Cytophagales bacterium]HAP64750.1 hypothetical protein [Cytophagales bacterium]